MQHIINQMYTISRLCNTIMHPQKLSLNNIYQQMDGYKSHHTHTVIWRLSFYREGEFIMLTFSSDSLLQKWSVCGVSQTNENIKLTGLIDSLVFQQGCAVSRPDAESLLLLRQWIIALVWLATWNMTREKSIFLCVHLMINKKATNSK